jgi:uncharacterized membrane protein
MLAQLRGCLAKARAIASTALLEPIQIAGATSKMGLIVLVIGLVIFLCAHLFVTRRGARADMIERFGIAGYRIGFSAVSIVGLAVIVWGFGFYRAEGYIDVWSPPRFMFHVTELLMLFAVIFLTAAFVPSHIQARLKHPSLAAVKTWALAHLLVNGDLGSIVMFGSFLAWGVYARIAAKRRDDKKFTPAPPGWTNDAIVVAIGIVVYLALGLAFHPIFIGVPVFGH